MIYDAELISIHSPRMGRDHGRGRREQRGRAAFQFTLPAWGETPDIHFIRPQGPISIHSPRMGRDQEPEEARSAAIDISIHSPRMGKDLCWWGAGGFCQDFNPLSPHGERL